MSDAPSLIKVLRSLTPLSVAELLLAIKESKTIVLFNTFDYQIGGEFVDHQREIEKHLIQLSTRSDEISFFYRASNECDWEPTPIQMVSNLIDSSILSWNQPYD